MHKGEMPARLDSSIFHRNPCAIVAAESVRDEILHSGEGGVEGEPGAVHKAGGAHQHKPGGGPPKPLCKNFGQLPKLTGEWVDHPDPQYRGIYSQVGTGFT